MSRVSCVLALFLALLVPAAGHAQEQTGVLQGRVIDSSAAVLPGTVVTVAGPTILGGSLSAVENENGLYLIRNIPIGAYKVSFEISRSETRVPEGVTVRANTTYTVNAELALAGVQETVLVQGETPLIETAATDVGFTFTKELMTNMPNARDPWAMISQAPGITTSGVNVGGTNTGNQQSFYGHGVNANQNTYILNGANVTDNTSNGASQFFFDVDSFEEMQVEVNSHSAEVQTPGIVLNIVPKSGTNVFRGSVSAYYNNENVSWDNVDSDLRARGVDRASNLHQYYDAGFDTGGPIMRDKIWFYGAFRFQDVQRYITGTKNPDGTFPIDHTYLWYPTVKVNWQAAKQHNVSGYFNMAQKKRFKRGLSLTRPVETTWDQQGSPIARLFTFRDDWSAGSKLLVALKVNIMDQGFSMMALEGIDTATTPATYDSATGVYHDAPPYEYGIAKNLREVGGTVNYYVDNWHGTHELKFGVSMSSNMQYGNVAGTTATTIYPANYRLVFFNAKPLEVWQFAPNAASVTAPTWSAFAQDSWKTGRFTLNVGARWDWQANRLNEVTAPTSPYFEAVTQPATDNLITWNTLSPRVGVVFDVTGDAKTLLKASYSHYVYQLWTEKGAQVSAAGTREAHYGWIDLNGDSEFQSNEQGALLSIIDAGKNHITIESDLKPSATDEITAGFVRQLAPNLSLELSYMHRVDKDQTWLINQSISSSDYTPVTGRDPGPDGVRGTADDGDALTFYELAASKVGLSSNYLATWPGYTHYYDGFEVTAIRRMANRWQLVGSFTVGADKENYGDGSYINPQDVDQKDGRRQEGNTPWTVKVMGTYQLPYNINLSGVYTGIAGNVFTRTVTSTAAVGRRLNQGSVTVLAEPRGSQAYETKHMLDLRVSYDISVFGGNRRVTLDFDIFNVFNTNAVTAIQTLSGSLYNRVSEFIPPRILRFGARFRF